MNPSREAAQCSPLQVIVTTLLIWCSGCAPERSTFRDGLTSERATVTSFVELTAEVDAIREDASIPGLGAGMVQGGEVVWVVGLGSGDVLHSSPVQLFTPFLTASVSKTVVALVAAISAAEGRVDLDQPIHELMGDGYVHPSGASYTLRQLLTHTAGARDDWDTLADGYVVGDAEQPLSDWVSDYFEPHGALYDPMDNFVAPGPGVERVYSNAGVALAAAVVQEATGIPFDDLCDQTLFEPLGLTHTGWHLADFEVEEVALPHLRTSGGPLPIPHYGVPDWPDGQLRSSAADFAVILAAISAAQDGSNPSTIPLEAVELLFEVPFPELDDRQALAWSRRRRGGRARVWSHGGSEMGSAAEVLIDPRTGDGVVVFANTDMDVITREALRAIQSLALSALSEG